MEDKYWFEKWQKNEIAFHEQNINADLIAYAHQLKLKPGDCILVPLCGKTKDMVWLFERGLHVIGVELSPIACNDFFAELNVTPHVRTEANFTRYQYKHIEILCGDIFSLSSHDLPTIHAVYDCKALIALSPELRKKYVTHLVTVVGTKIRMLLLAIDTPCQIKPPPFPVNQAEVNSLYGSYFAIQLLKCLPNKEISASLIQKGYTEMNESVYLISEKTITK